MFNFSLIKNLKKIFFPFYKNKDLKFVFKKIQEGYPSQPKTAMFVGGCVRNHLLNEDIDDIDIATSLTTDQVREKFKDTKYKVIDSGIKHGTVTLVLKKLKLELTTLRKDIKTDGRHAEIEYTDDWQEDSNRRDFTINAIYLDADGKIFDPQLGIHDLKNYIVKFIGDPQKRIEEDYLRIIRFIRFSLLYKNEIEKKIIEVIKLNLNGIKKMSKERILIELFKILNTKNFEKLNNKQPLKEIFLLIFPEFKYFERLNKLNEIKISSIFDKTILLSILLIDEKNNHEYFLHKYNVSNNLKDDLNLITKNYINSLKNKNFFKKDLKKNIFHFGKKHLELLSIVCFSINKKIKLDDYLNILNNIKKISLPQFPFDGNYLKDKGIKEGKSVGETLKLIQDEWLNNGFKISNQRISEIIDNQKN
jgi:tRNA nucleotidyltransferase/poly(A) polymerase